MNPHKCAVSISVQTASFDPGREIRELQLASHDVGGISVFVVVVRDINKEKPVTGLYLEHYPGMTENQIAQIVYDALSHWEFRSATVWHALVNLHPGDYDIFVIV